jgi:hypothetical protein
VSRGDAGDAAERRLRQLLPALFSQGYRMSLKRLIFFNLRERL